jgi:DnaJ-class molecular chaperone
MFHLSKFSRRRICYARINSIYHKKIKSEICKVCLGSGMILDRETNKSYTCFACNGIGVVNKF